MAILIGVDEAGYGPNYGPLVVATTAWQVEAGVRGQGTGVRDQESGVKRAGASSPPAAATMPAPPDLYALLADAVVRSPAHCARRVAMADSKALYSPAAGLRVLERSVLGALQASAASAGAPPPACLGALIGSTDGDPRQRRRELACHGDDALALPVAAAPADVAAAAAVLHDVGQRCGATLLAMRARLVFPAEFNELCEAHGTKGAALSHTTLALVRRTLDALPDREPQPVHIDLDKHGGRSRYGALLQHHFPEGWIDAVVETRRESRYHWEYRGAPVAATFRVGCEQLLPTALASMTAKYLRELTMRAFNAFWLGRVAGLRPTAGYPLDARRFRAEIAAEQRRLGIDDRRLWRSR